MISTSILSSLSEVEIIEAGEPTNGESFLRRQNRIRGFSSRHFANIKKASESEMLFMQIARPRP